MPSTLTVNRNSSKDAQQREINVYLDGDPIAELMYGQTISKEIAPGPHKLLVDNTWNKQTSEFTAIENETVSFLAQNTASSFSQFLLGIFGAGPIRVSLTRQ
ncbi:MAG TPA: hypothetical protein VKD70_09015 [Candidatus Acidoferrum sp.]|nr:hypothetical protein [Candidatus Acidoferrum sp.]